MKKSIFIFFAVLAVEVASATPTDWMYLVTKDQFGVIDKNTTYADLVNLFGKDKLRDETRTGPEGEDVSKCTIVYKGTALEMAVYWQPDKWHKKISIVECTKAGSPYHTGDSLKIGSSLNEVVKANKAFVSFYGFEWDYGGLITDYHQGKLEKAGVNYTLGYKGKTDEALLGDGEFTSKMPAVIKRAKQISVVKIMVSFTI